MKKKIIKFSLVLGFFALSLPVEASSFKETQTRQNPNTGYIQYEFEKEASISIAPTSNDNEGALCGASQSGAMRYNTMIKAIEYCDGSVWVSIAASSCAAGEFMVKDAFGKATCTSVTCPKGQMAKYDATTGLFKCVNIYASMNCIFKTAQSTSGYTAVATTTCPDDRYVLTTSCDRLVPSNHVNRSCPKSVKGLFTEEFISIDRKTATCKSVDSGNGYGVRIQTVCCQ